MDGKRVTGERVTGERVTGQSTVDGGPDGIEPGGTGSGVVEPDAIEPDTIEPGGIGSGIVEPGGIRSADTGSCDIELGDIESSDVERAGVESGGIESGVREPGVDGPVIRVRDLSLDFPTADGPVHALSGIDLDVRRGDFVSFIGPSGCGKTTLLRVIADLERATSGSILVNGTSPEAARRERAYGYVFQAASLYPWRNIERNVSLPLEIMGLPAAERARRVAANLALVDLAGFGRKYPWQLSGGMQQRASIARALAVEPALLLMDEPFGALDEIVRDHLNEQLLALWRRTGKTIVFVTHSIPEAVYLSTRIVVMSPRPGRIHEIIDSDLPDERPLDIRETPAFVALANRVRDGLRAGDGAGA